MNNLDVISPVLRRLQAVGVAVLLFAIAGFFGFGTAYAASATVTLNPPAPAGGFNDQQTVTITVGANSTFTPGSGVFVLECADAGGLAANLPTSDATCDGNTVQGSTVLVAADGSLKVSNYPIFQLPSSALAEATTSKPVCNSTNQCVLFVGQNQNDFTKPHVFSAPYSMSGSSAPPTTTTSTTSAPGSTTTTSTLGTTTTSTSTTAVSSTAPTVTGLSPTFGAEAGGTSVTITGTNFSGASAVSFGTIPAVTFTVVSATSITATSPVQTTATPFDVTVTTPQGKSATTLSDHFTYTSATSPTVTSISPTTGPTAGGTSITVTGTNLTGATAVSFGATAGTSLVVASATSLTVTSPSGSAGVADVTVTTPNGVSYTLGGDQFTYADTSGSGSGSFNSGFVSSGSSGGGGLAFTGSSVAVIWLSAAGLLMIVGGTLGRRIVVSRRTAVERAP